MAQHCLSGVSFHFKLHSWSDVTKCFIVHQALKEWRKEYVQTEHKRPISYALLVQLLAATVSQCSSLYEALLFHTCFCLAFFATLCVLAEDIVLANGGIRIWICRSKMDVLG